MKILRTDSAAFANLPDYPFSPNWMDLEIAPNQTARLHYLDEGRPDSPAVILMHGEPSWSYLYRKMIPLLVARGLRVLAPDLIGFGKSDKPEDTAFYTYRRHVEWMETWRNVVAPGPVTLFCQDWGGLIGLRMVANAPDRFNAVVASNTFLPTGEGASDSFLRWREFARTSPEFPIGSIISRGVVRNLTAEEVAAYDAPFPYETFKAAARAFPLLVPVDKVDEGAQDNRAAWSALSNYRRPFLTLFGDNDPVTDGLERIFQERVAGAAGQPHRILNSCGHFSQEDCPGELADAVIRLASIGHG